MVATKALIVAAAFLEANAMRKTNLVESQAPSTEAVEACTAALGPKRMKQTFKVQKEKMCNGPMNEQMEELWGGIADNFNEETPCAEVTTYVEAVQDWDSAEVKKFKTDFLTSLRQSACAAFDPDAMCECVHPTEGRFLEKCDSVKDNYDSESEPFDWRCQEADGKLTRVNLQKAEAPSDEVCAKAVAAQITHLGAKINLCTLEPMSETMIDIATKYTKRVPYPNQLVGTHYRATGGGISSKAYPAVVLECDRCKRGETKVRFTDDNVVQKIPKEYIVETVPQMCAQFATEDNFEKIGECYQANWEQDGCDEHKDRLTKFMTEFKQSYCR
jgi:hypothetical protein